MSEKLGGLVWFCIVAIITIIWIAPTLLIYLTSSSWQNAAEIGEAFGAASALFSGLTLLSLIYTLRLGNLESAQRQKQVSQAQETATFHLLQISLATQLQTYTALIAEYRRSIVELSPEINDVPTAPSLLAELRHRVQHEPVANAGMKRRNMEVLNLIDELSLLQNGLRGVHESLERIRLRGVSVDAGERPKA